MRDAHSRTFSSQTEMDRYAAQQTSRAAAELSHLQTAGELLAFLMDDTTLTAPASILCRQIRSQDGLVSKEVRANLRQSGGVFWPDEAVSQATAELSSISCCRHGLMISPSQWERYLLGDLLQWLRRDTILQLALVTGMSRKTTIDLLMACGQAPYKLQRPLELICWFCQCIPNVIFTWRDVERLLDMYGKIAAEESKGVKSEQKKSAGTVSLLFDWSVDEILGIGDPEAEGEQALMELMVQNCTKTGAFSRTARSAYLRFLEYLNVLEFPERSVDLLEWTGGMVDQQTQRTLFRKRYHVWASGICSGFADVDRRDVLLLGYVIIDGYMSAEKAGREIFLAMTKNGGRTDRCMAQIGKGLDALCPDADVKERQVLYCRVLDQLLAEFGFHAFYPPAAFDRFILLSLLAGHPVWNFHHLPEEWHGQE